MSFAINNTSYWSIIFAADAVDGYTPVIAFMAGNNKAYHYQSDSAAQLPSGSTFEFGFVNTKDVKTTDTAIFYFIVLYRRL